MMPRKTLRLLTAFLSVGTLVCGGVVLAGEDTPKDPGNVVDQVGASVKRLADKIGKEATDVAKKLEQSETPKKVGRELKRSAESLGDKAGQAGKKLQDSLTSK
jgi:hypothetical protein